MKGINSYNKQTKVQNLFILNQYNWIHKNFYCLESFTSDSSGELEISGHDGDSLGVDGAQVGVFEKTNQISFSSFLEGKDSRGLESQVSLVVMSDFSDESLEGKLSDEEISGLLVLSDFSEGDGTGSVSMGLLDTTGSGSALSGGLGGELLSGSLGTGRFSGGLLSSGHFEIGWLC